jgi:putative tryptophan/tyrosine transport system substrate-binding protein
MRRREFAAGLGAAVAWPLAVPAQQPRRGPVVGFLTTRSQEEAADHRAAFLRGLERAGYVEERNLHVEYRWAGGRNERLGAFAAELARLPVSVLVTGGDPSAAAAKAAAGATPIVFMIAEDPVRAGLVASFNNPQGNATGISLITSALGSKRLDVVREMVPGANLVALLVNPDNPSAETHAEEVRAAAQALGRRLVVLQSRSAPDFAAAFETLRNERAGALVVQGDPFFDSERNALIALARRHGVPAIYHIREFPVAGGLVSYGPSLVDSYEQLGGIAGRVLKGERPADLPVMRPTKFELVLNMKTANALRVGVPLHLQQLADEVIE